MKILKAGREQKGWSKEFICTGKGNGKGGCGAKLLVEAGDIFKTRSSHYDGSNEVYQTFRCAQCGVETDFEDFVPFSIPEKKVWLDRQENNMT